MAQQDDGGARVGVGVGADAGAASAVRAGTVVVAGEALVDLIGGPDGSLVAVAGGGPFNAARAVARLGVDTAFLGALSSDRFGRLLRATLSGDGVRLDLAVTVHQPTTLALAEVDRSGTASYHFYVEGTSAPMLEPAQARRILTGAAEGLPVAVHVGSLGLVLEPMAGTLVDLAGALPAAVLLFADPNCRAAVIADPRSYRAGLDRVLDRADVVKVSTEDLEYLEPGVAPVQAATALRRAGTQVLLVTDGPRPVLVLHAGGAFEVPVPAVRVVDTVGAGDTFGGAFLAGWVQSGRDVDALADASALRPVVGRAARASALACTRAGAQPPSAAELDASRRS